MGIVNVTPDSFSDGGRFRGAEPALARARELAAAGADLVDVGGESTRPGAAEVSADEELERVVPVIRAIRAELEVAVSVDTRKAEVARAALEAGARVVNDVSGFADGEMAATVAAAGAGVVLMHMRGTPATMQTLTEYGDVAAEVASELGAAVARARAAGIDDACVALDPGIGFAKTAEQNWTVLAALRQLHGLGHPVVVATSRKRFLGELLADGEGGLRPPSERDDATTATSALAAATGAWCVRVHAVRASADAVRVAARWAAG